MLRVELLNATPISLVARAARMCTGTLDKMDSEGDNLGPNDERVITERILQRGKPYDPLYPPHDSVLEHAVYTVQLRFSRAVLQEMSRHRIASPSVESTRWALGRILRKEADPLEHLMLTGEERVDALNIRQLKELLEVIKEGCPNDKAKYALPESFLTNVIWTINARSLRNYLALRTATRALWEINALAHTIYAVLPDSHRVLFTDRVHAGEIKEFVDQERLKNFWRGKTDSNLNGFGQRGESK